MCSSFTATGDPPGTQMLHFRPSGLISFLAQRLHVLGTVVLHVAAACAVPFQRAQWHATLRATRARNAPANVTIGFRFVGLCGTMFTPVLEYVIAAPCLQIPSRWGAFWWRMGWLNVTKSQISLNG